MDKVCAILHHIYMYIPHEDKSGIILRPFLQSAYKPRTNVTSTNKQNEKDFLI